MFFKLHKDAKIGFKVLSAADLGNSDGHTTAIGLYEDTLKFLVDFKQYAYSQFIYENTTEEMFSFVDPITTPNGGKRSPKIRAGTKKELEARGNDLKTIVQEIKEIANSDLSSKWYLMWFGLENRDLVFILIKEGSRDYKDITYIINDNLPKSGRYKFKNNNIANFINEKVNNVYKNYLLELEEAVNNCDINTIGRIDKKEYDLDKVREAGVRGEKLVNDYLEVLKRNQSIKDFIWINKESESYESYDFIITCNDNTIYYSDAKSTLNGFENGMYFSNAELKFINENSNYLIHRVYNMNTEPSLKICNNINLISTQFIDDYKKFRINIEASGLRVHSTKIVVLPSLEKLNFGEEISFIN